MKNEDPIISVIVPVFNTPKKLLQRCIDSLLNQTLDNIEFIFVDDKSTDDSLNYLRNVESLHPQIRVIAQDENKRQGGARNTGIKAAKSDLIGFCDSDDFIEPTMYEKLYKKLISKPDYDCVQCLQDRYEEGKGYTFEEYAYRDESLAIDGIELSSNNRDVLLLSGGGVCTYLIKKNIFIDNNLWFPEKTAYEDNYIWPFVLMSIHKIGFISERLYHYYVNTQSTTHNPRMLSERIKVEDDKLTELKRRGLLKEYHDCIEYSFWALAYKNTINMIIQFNLPFMEAVNMCRSQKRKLMQEFPCFTHNKYIVEDSTKNKKVYLGGFYGDVAIYFRLLKRKIKFLLCKVTNKKFV